MTQSILVQVGQCGNQIGCRFWDLALREHAKYNKDALFDESMSSFFRNVDSKSGREVPLGTGNEKIRGIKARSVLVDMEEGVVNEILTGPLRELFDAKQLVTDVSGNIYKVHVSQSYSHIHIYLSLLSLNGFQSLGLSNMTT